MSLKNKVAIVTGAGSGMGAAIAQKFATEGAKVTMVDLSKENLTKVSKLVESKGAKPLLVVGDVTSDADRKKIVNDTITEFGQLDILVNTAGISGWTNITDENALPPFEKCMNVNFNSVVYLTHLAVPHLIKTKGNIVNFSSIAGQAVFSASVFPYAVSKAAIEHFTRCIAVDLAPSGVRVNAICPGPTNSKFIDNAVEDPKAVAHIWEQMKNSGLLKKLVEPEEIADLVEFIVSDKGRSLTGAVHLIDNGALLHRKV